MFTLHSQDNVPSDKIGPMHTDKILSQKILPLGDAGPVAEDAVFGRIYPYFGIAGFYISDLCRSQSDLPVFGIESDHLRFRLRVRLEQS